MYKINMHKTFRLIVCLFLSAVFIHTPAYAKDDNAIRNAIIQESISNYSGNCPCPYNSTSNGSRCGKRSAYSRAGGYATICYDADVTQEMIKEYRNKNKKK
jgi:hypothetical protein